MGLMFARFALPFVKTMGEARIPRLDAASLDGTALAVCVISIAVASLVCGLAPVVQLRSRPLGRSIGSSHRGSSDPGSRLRSLLVGAQVSMTVVLLAGAGLLMRSFVELSSVDPGFEAKGTLAVRLDMPGQAYSAPERSDLRPRLRDAVASLPGVVAVGATATNPFSGNNLSNFVARLDRLPDRAADFTPIHWRAVTPGFFEAMGVELKAGRTFVDSDGDEGLGQVVIGESLASMMWGGEDPIDQIMVWSEPEGGRMRVIGVVEDLRDVGLAEEAHATIYRPHRYIPWAVMTLVARVQGDPATVAAGIRAQIQEVVPGMPVREIRSLEENLHMAVAQPRFNFQLLASFAAVGLLMAVLGIYGLTAFEVRRRFREIGIRLTLGANPDGIRTMIFRQRMRLTAVGAGAGLVIARVLTRWIESSLYGITANDPITWIGVLSVVAGASALAAYLPARKATQVHPRDVLSGD
jgi:predicted permease